MCAPNVIQNVVRGGADIMTFGTAEIGGASSKLGAAAAGIVAPKPAATPPMPATATNLGPAQTTKQTPDNADAQATAAAKARRAAAMRAGIMSTIGPGLGSIGNTTPKTPAAYASGMKTALGQ